ncbi:MAG: subtilin biosynthesis sensor protein SpaK [Hespellia sp.]|nr:subtilin biosynthesis sensor protein SpaK [Hespellia sp.]
MGYETIDELEHFQFREVHISEIRQITNSSFYAILDNVTILETNSCNRDIFDMRTNNLTLRIEEGQIVSFVEEGYKIFDANEILMQEVADRILPPEEYNAMLKDMTDATLYSIKKDGTRYIFDIDACDHTYTLVVEGSHDTEEWNRFLKKEDL